MYLKKKRLIKTTNSFFYVPSIALVWVEHFWKEHFFLNSVLPYVIKKKKQNETKRKCASSG
jgi:uncharacterized membrane protein